MCPASYVGLHADGRLAERRDAALDALRACRLCPRQCGVNRLADQRGYCRTGRRVRVASAHAHFGEERPLVGSGGSGTIFLSSCNLFCTFCQNFEISHRNAGAEIEAGELAEVMLALAGRGCHNINFVTPTHVVPQILEALVPAAEKGLNLPLVYNSGGYDSVETLRLLDGVFDIYMPDLKFWDDAVSERLCNAGDYRARAKEAICEMHRQVGDLRLGERGVAVRGLLVRHLVMPNGLAGTAGVARFLAEEISPDTYVNVMAQYHPCGKAAGDRHIGRRPSAAEYEDAVAAARAAGLRRLDR
jgi:putative pyruvate formate lyase activating enzyme